jgi:hypothetical protein
MDVYRPLDDGIGRFGIHHIQQDMHDLVAAYAQNCRAQNLQASRSRNRRLDVSSALSTALPSAAVAVAIKERSKGANTSSSPSWVVASGITNGKF